MHEGHLKDTVIGCVSVPFGSLSLAATQSACFLNHDVFTETSEDYSSLVLGKYKFDPNDCSHRKSRETSHYW